MKKEHTARGTRQKAKDQTIAETAVDIDPENRKKIHMNTPQRGEKRKQYSSEEDTSDWEKHHSRNTEHESRWENKKDIEQKGNHIIRKKDTGSRDTMNPDTNMKDTQSMKKDGKDLTKDTKPDTKTMIIEEMKAETATKQDVRKMTIDEKKNTGPKNDQPREHPDITENITKKNIKDQRKENQTMQWKYSRDRSTINRN